MINVVKENCKSNVHANRHRPFVNFFLGLKVLWKQCHKIKCKNIDSFFPMLANFFAYKALLPYSFLSKIKSFQPILMKYCNIS